MSALPATARSSVNINSLAREIVGHILTLGAEGEEVGTTNLKRRYKFLLPATMISKSWSVEARRLLWEKVDIINASGADALLQAKGFGEHTTRYLNLLGFGLEKGKMGVKEYTERTVGSLRGLEGLQLVGYRREDDVSIELLRLPSLLGLTYLRLGDVVLRAPLGDDFTPINLPSLQKLDLDEYALISYPHTYFHPYTILSTPLLRHLMVFYNDPLGDELLNDLRSYLRAVASDLRWIDIDMSTKLSPSIVETFKCFTSLEQLDIKCGSDFRQISQHLSLSLRRLRVTTEYEDFLESEFTAYFSPLLRLQDLKELELESWSRKEAESVTGGEDLVTKFEALGVVVEWGKEDESEEEDEASDSDGDGDEGGDGDGGDENEDWESDDEEDED